MPDWYASMIGMPLTPREETILAGVQTGATNKQIGQVLGISKSTVAQHLAVINRKLGTRNRIQLVAAAERRA